MRWLSALKLASFMTCALFAVMKSDVRAETDLVCHNEPDVALSRFLRSYEEAFDRLVVTRGLPQTHPYSSMLVDYFELDIAERVSLFPGMLFIIYHVEDGATCAFGWHNPVSAQDDIAREVVHTYVRGDGDPKALSVQIGSLVEAMQTVVMRGPARAPDRGATALFRSQIPSEADIDAVLADLSRALLIEQLEPVLSETNHLVAHLPGDLAAIPFLAVTRQDGAALVESHSLTSLDRLSRFLDKAYRYAQLDEQVNGRLVLLSERARQLHDKDVVDCLHLHLEPRLRGHEVLRFGNAHPASGHRARNIAGAVPHVYLRLIHEQMRGQSGHGSRTRHPGGFRCLVSVGLTRYQGAMQEQRQRMQRGR